MKQEFSLSNLLSGTFEQIGANAKVILIYLAVMVPLGTVSLMFEGPGSNTSLGVDVGFMLTESLLAQGALAIAVVVGVFIVGVILYYWLYAGMMARTTSPSFGRFLPFVGIYLLSVIGIVFGFALLIIPGIILSVRWLIVLPMVLAGEKPAIDSFSESWNLTKGRGWSIFGGAIILFVIFLVIAAVLGGATTVLGGVGSLPAMFVGSAIENAGTILFIAFVLAAYRLLQDDSEELVEMFE